MNTNEPVTINCKDRDRIFAGGAEGSEQEWRALEAHARTCSACAKELSAWRELNLAAREMRNDSDTSDLWPRIAEALAADTERHNNRARRWAWLRFWDQPGGLRLTWQTALVAACALALTVGAARLFLNRPTGLGVASSSPLLNDPALAEVERSEKAYEQAIEKLAEQANPQLDRPATPLLTSYHEKILVIDSAIDDLRAQAGMNPSNAHLRRELLAMYQEKQRTLEDVLEAKSQ